MAQRNPRRTDEEWLNLIPAVFLTNAGVSAVAIRFPAVDKHTVSCC